MDAPSTSISGQSPRRVAFRVAKWREKAESHLRAQDWPSCVAACRTLLQLDPRHHFAQETLATALLQLGETEAATDAVQRLLEISPRDPFHRLRFATLLQMSGRAGAALQQFEQIAQMYPDAPFASDAREAVENLDRLQTSQILLLAAERDDFRWQLERDPIQTLEEYGFQLSENGLDSLRNMLPGDEIETPKTRLH